MATVGDVRGLQEEIARDFASCAAADAETLFTRFEPEDLGPGTSTRHYWYLDADGKEQSPFHFGTQEMRTRVLNASFALWDRMAELAPDPASGRRHWKVYFLTIDIPTGHYHFDFEYEDAARWHPNPGQRIPPFDPLTGECMLRDRG